MSVRIVAANANHFAAIGHYVAHGHGCPTLESNGLPRLTPHCCVHHNFMRRKILKPFQVTLGVPSFNTHSSASHPSAIMQVASILSDLTSLRVCVRSFSVSTYCTLTDVE